jgi:hypothetical protein
MLEVSSTLDIILRHDRNINEPALTKVPKICETINPADLVPPDGIPTVLLQSLQIDISISSSDIDECSSHASHIAIRSSYDASSDHMSEILFSASESQLSDLPVLSSTSESANSLLSLSDSENEYFHLQAHRFKDDSQFPSASVSYHQTTFLPKPDLLSYRSFEVIDNCKAAIRKAFLGSSSLGKDYTVIENKMGTNICRMLPSIFNPAFRTV